MAEGSRVVGLTGGIASGKSTVAAMLRARGAPIVDADLVARQVVEPGSPALAEITEHFGRGVLTAAGELDRKKLGTIVFSDAEMRALLGRITHPRIAAASQQQIAELAATGAPIVIYEAALIVENKLHLAMSALIVVIVPRDIQLERLAARDQIDPVEAARRIDAQLPLAEKVAVADYVIDNGGTLEETEAQVALLWEELSGADKP